MNTTDKICSVKSPVEFTRAYFGAIMQKSSIVFRYFDPSADRVFVVGSFNGWTESLPMQKDRNGVWVADVAKQLCPDGSTYKYKVCKNETVSYVSDPFCDKTDGEPFKNSVIGYESGYEWGDQRYLERSLSTCGGGYDGVPFHVYEMSIEGWCAGLDGDVNCDRAAHELCEYARQMGYTHVLVTDAIEGGAPNETFGACDGLGRFVDVMHKAHVGVIVEWNFDNGQDIYSKQGVAHEVILHLMHSCHIDGVALTVTDGIGALAACDVARGIRLGKPDAAIIVRGKSELIPECDDIIIYDERGGQALLDMFTSDFDKRDASLSDLTSGGNGIRGFGRKRYLGSMPGDDWRAFAGARAAFSALMLLCGKKHTYMGCETGTTEGDGQMDWRLLDSDCNAGLQLCFSDTGEIYLAHPLLARDDNAVLTDGSYSDSGIAMVERSGGGESLLILINLGADAHESKSFAVKSEGVYDEIFNSDSLSYGGSGVVNQKPLRARLIDGKKMLTDVRVAPLAVSVFKKRQK